MTNNHHCKFKLATSYLVALVCLWCLYVWPVKAADFLDILLVVAHAFRPFGQNKIRPGVSDDSTPYLNKMNLSAY